eukprot:12932031-Prorocentrum_lima.AAC.1
MTGRENGGGGVTGRTFRDHLSGCLCLFRMATCKQKGPLQCVAANSKVFLAVHRPFHVSDRVVGKSAVTRRN